MSSETQAADPVGIVTNENAAVRKVFVRLLWFLFVAGILTSLDRTNIGFAGLQMNQALGLTATAFGFAVSIFNVGYILAQIPSNVLFARLGAKLWLPTIMIAWGLISAATMFASGALGLYALRFALGLAELGFHPGIVLYLSYWVPTSKRARALSLMMVSQPINFALAPLVSGRLLDMRGMGGLAGWQWLFLLEGLPTVLLGVFAYFYLTAYPRDARWLTDDEKSALAGAIAREEKISPAHARSGVWPEIFSLKMLLLILVYIGIPISIVSYVTWSPSIVREFLPQGSSYFYVGLINAIPAGPTLLAMVYWSWRSDKSGERTGHIIASLLVCALGWLLVAYASSGFGQLIGLTLALMGTYAGHSVLFAFATSMLSPAARPIGIATIFAGGTLSSLVSPVITGYFKDLTGQYTIGLTITAGVLLVSCMATLVASRWVARGAVPAR